MTVRHVIAFVIIVFIGSSDAAKAQATYDRALTEQRERDATRHIVCVPIRYRGHGEVCVEVKK